MTSNVFGSSWSSWAKESSGGDIRSRFDRAYGGGGFSHSERSESSGDRSAKLGIYGHDGGRIGGAGGSGGGRISKGGGSGGGDGRVGGGGSSGGGGRAGKGGGGSSGGGEHSGYTQYLSGVYRGGGSS